MNLTIRTAIPADLPRIMEIYASARQYMKATGNPTQWGEAYPPSSMIQEDIAKGQSYVIVDENDFPRGVFAFLLGEDPTYQVIDGAWLNAEPYGTIHRIAGDGSCRGIFAQAVSYCQQQIGQLRVDTHEDNHTMQKAILREGFHYCGIIHVDDGTPRLAYQKTSNEATS